MNSNILLVIVIILLAAIIAVTLFSILKGGSKLLYLVAVFSVLAAAVLLVEHLGTKVESVDDFIKQHSGQNIPSINDAESVEGMVNETNTVTVE